MKKEMISFVIGAGSPDNCSWLSSASKSEAGPLSLYPERWLSLQKELEK